MMTKNEKLQTIRELLGSEASLLDAAYVLDALDPLSADDAQEIGEDEFLDYAAYGLRNGQVDIEEILSRYGDIHASVERYLNDGRLLDALREWLRTWDHVAAYGTSETCLAGEHDFALDDLERQVTSRNAREAIQEFANWWARAYAAYVNARQQDKLDDVCELLLTGSLDKAEELLQ